MMTFINFIVANIVETESLKGKPVRTQPNSKQSA